MSGADRRPLNATLLHERIAADDQPSKRWAYPRWGIAVVSIFVAYHALVLILHNLPAGGLSRGVHRHANKLLQSSEYFAVTGIAQSWAMFAPNPHRTNMFMRVALLDAGGETWDLAHDIYGRRKYPYLFYDRMGKINRRIIESKGYRRHYAAWVCREWEREHDGEPGVSVSFTKMWSRVPTPERAYKFMYFDPMDLYLNRVKEDTFPCAAIQHGQLTNEHRARYGLPPRPEDEIRKMEQRTWVHRKASLEKRRGESAGADAPGGDG